MDLPELARRVLPFNITLLALLAISYAAIEFTHVQAGAATYAIIYISLGFLAINFVIIYAVYRYRT